jgi:hypothetical protein
MSAGTASAIIAALGLLVMILMAALGFTIKAIIKTTTMEVKLGAIAESLERIVRDKDRVHAEILAQIKEDRIAMLASIKDDRAANNKRLLYLEHEVWPRSKGSTT